MTSTGLLSGWIRTVRKKDLDTRLWAAAAPTQVRPMNFFENPNLREFLLEPESLRRIREAAFIDDGSLIRK